MINICVYSCVCMCVCIGVYIYIYKSCLPSRTRRRSSTRNRRRCGGGFEWCTLRELLSSYLLGFRRKTSKRGRFLRPKVEESKAHSTIKVTLGLPWQAPSCAQKHRRGRVALSLSLFLCIYLSVSIHLSLSLSLCI